MKTSELDWKKSHIEQTARLIKAIAALRAVTQQIDYCAFDDATKKLVEDALQESKKR